MAQEVASLEARFTANTTGFTAGINSVTSGMQNASRSIAGHLDSMGQGFRSVGTRMVAVGGIATGALGGAVIQAVNFQEAMTNAGAILGNTQEEMADLNREVRGMGAASRFGPQAAAEAFYDIVSGVADASTHMDILNAAIATSEAGSADLGATTSALISVMNSYGFSADQAAFASDVMTRTVGMGVLTMDQLASSIPQVTGMANSMGIEFDTLSGYLAFMTTKGISASQSATLLNSSMSTLLNPTAGLASAINDLGYESGEAMVAALGLDGAYAAIREYGGGSFAGLITSQEALRAGLILTDASASEFFDNFKAGVDGATQSARDIQMESVAAQWDVLKSSISELAIVIGDAFLPAIDDILGIINPIVPRVTEWAEQNPELVRTLGAVAIGVTVAGVALVGLGIALSAAAVAVSGFGSALAWGGVILGTILTPIGLLIIGSAALYAAWQTNFAGIQNVVETASGGIRTAIDAMNLVITGDFKRGMFGGAYEDDPRVSYFLGVHDSLVEIVSGIPTAVNNAFSDVDTHSILEVGLLIASLTTPFGWVMMAARLMGVNMVDAIEGLITDVAAALSGVDFSAPVSEWGPAVLTAFETGLGTVSTWVNDTIITPIVDFLTGGSVDVAGGVEEWGPDLLASAEGIIQSLVYEFGRLPGRAGALLTKYLPDIIAGVVEYGPQILAKIVETLGDIAVWTFENIITPFTTGLADGATDLITAVSTYGDDILAEILAGLGDLAFWVAENIVAPIAQRLVSMGYDVQEAVTGVGQSIKDGIMSGISDIVDWVRTNIVDPVVGEIQRIGAAAQEAIDSIVSIPAQLSDAATGAVGSAAEGAANVVGGDTVSGALSGFNDAVGAAQSIVGFFTGGRYTTHPQPQGRYAAGFQPGAGGPAILGPGHVAVHTVATEPLQPNHSSYSGTSSSSSSYGGRGNIYVDTLYVQTDNIENLYDQLLTVSRNRAGNTLNTLFVAGPR